MTKLAILLIVLACAGCASPQRTIATVVQQTPTEIAQDGSAAGVLKHAQADLAKAQEAVRTAQQALNDERTASAQAKVYWFAGILGVIALAAAGLAIFVPSIARWAIRLSLAAAAVAALAVFAAWLLPYLWWIGAAISLIGIVGAIVYWRLDAKSRDQVLSAVNEVKDKVPDFKTVFRQHIDSDADKAIDAARKRLGLDGAPQ